MVGIELQSCSLLLLLCPPRAASGSHQWKLAHQNEGKAKATDRDIEMTSSCSSPGLGWGKLPCLNMCVGRRADCLWCVFTCSCACMSIHPSGSCVYVFMCMCEHTRSPEVNGEYFPQSRFTLIFETRSLTKPGACPLVDCQSPSPRDFISVPPV